MVSGVLLLEVKHMAIKLTSFHHLIPSLRTRGTLLLLPHAFPWRCDSLETEWNLTYCKGKSSFAEGYYSTYWVKKLKEV
jgi:hypothetical protein